MFRFNNGDGVIDKITGFSGVVMGRTDWLTGCNTIGVMPRGLNEKGEMQDIKWIDENRLELVCREEVSLKKEELKKEDDPGGPLISIPRQTNQF